MVFMRSLWYKTIIFYLFLFILPNFFSGKLIRKNSHKKLKSKEYKKYEIYFVIHPYIRFVVTAPKMKFSINDFFRKCYLIRRKLRIWSHLLRKSLMQKCIFCAVMPF